MNARSKTLSGKMKFLLITASLIAISGVAIARQVNVSPYNVERCTLSTYTDGGAVQASIWNSIDGGYVWRSDCVGNTVQGGTVTATGFVSTGSGTASNFSVPFNVTFAQDGGVDLGVAATGVISEGLLADGGYTVTIGQTGLTVGQGGGAIPSIFTGTTTNPSIVNAQTCVDYTVTVTGATTTSDCFTNSTATGPGAGLITGCYISAADTCKLRICNVTAGNVTPTTGTYRCTVVNH